MRELETETDSWDSTIQTESIKARDYFMILVLYPELPGFEQVDKRLKHRKIY